jgi:formylglycine-generating enzyme required for sulfatase activity
MKLFFLAAIFISLSATAQDSVYMNSVGMEFVFIKPGTFVAGRFQPTYPKPGDRANSDEGTYSADEYKRAEMMAKRDSRPGFKVEIKKPFFIGRYELTQEQWKKVMGSNPSVFQGDKISADGERHPVENITWNDAQQFIKKLNAMDRKRTYRLPTEFEWEYAARAGATDDISWEEIRLQAQLGTKTTNVVGQKKPNEWGLYDMLGNVWEWTSSIYKPYPYVATDGREADSPNADHVLRSGGWDNNFNGAFTTSARTSPNSSDAPQAIAIGFRCARSV